MITPDEALVRLLALARPVDLETLPLGDASGRWAAGPVQALSTQPARNLSAMDGYAIRFVDMAGPWHLIGTSAAGLPFQGHVAAHDTVRILTGAAMPDGADCVLVQEEADLNREADRLTLTGSGPERAGAHVRRAGSDFAAGDVLIEAGVHLSPARIGLAAIAGHATLSVRRRVRVALISTGDELVPVGADPGCDCLPSSNAAMLAAMMTSLPVDITDFGIVADDRLALASVFAEAASHDIVVTTGGASVGDYDLVRPALLDAGADIDFWTIAMRPGKPMMAGQLGHGVVLGLPGNPVSAFVTGTLFLKPLVAHMSGARDPAPPALTARLAEAMPAVASRTDYVRAQWVDGSLSPLGGDSGMLVPLASAAALIVRPAGSPPASAGEDVRAIILA